MNLRYNLFVIFNTLFLSAFAISFFGLLDWAIASVIMVTGASLSTCVGAFTYSKKFIEGVFYRGVFSFGFLSTGYLVFKLGEYLNHNFFDGAVTIVMLLYFVAVTIVLYVMGKRFET